MNIIVKKIRQLNLDKKLKGGTRRELGKRAMKRIAILLAILTTGSVLVSAASKDSVVQHISIEGLTSESNGTPMLAVAEVDREDYKVKISEGNANIKIPKGYDLLVDGSKQQFLAEDTLTVIKEEAKVVVKNSTSVIATGKEVKFERVDDSLNFFEVKKTSSKNFTKYPGDVIFRCSSKGGLIVINSLELETYLKGVLPYEIGPNSPKEALKAQAVTARSFAVKRIGKYKADGYDVTDSTSDQVYKGYHEEAFDENSDIYKAVEETRGEVLVYEDELIEGLFYSNNGGQTANDAYVWSSNSDKPYYTSKEDEYDTYLSDRVKGWAKLDYKIEYTSEELRQKIISMSKNNPNYFKGQYCTPSFNGLGKDFNIEVISQKDGYVNRLRISDSEGRSYTFNNEASRWALGLRSQQFSIKAVLGGFVIEGAGYGHGIGMSQNGAINRAEDGHTYREILEFYYEGIRVEQDYFGK